MEFIQYTLPNGIRCIHKKVDSAVVHCSLTINTGSRDELPSEYGMAHLLEHAFFKGTTRRRAHNINNRLENLGGELNAYTTKEETVIHTTTLQQDFVKAADLISDMVFNSTFPSREIDKEKEIIVDEINSYKDTPSERIFDDFEDLIFKGSDLGHNILGPKNALKKYTREELIGFVARTYNTDQMVFASIGNITETRFKAVCHRYFGHIPPSQRTFTRTTAHDYAPFDKVFHRSRFQSHCVMGNRAYGLDNNDRIILSLLTNLLGGPSANSLLNMAVRERNGLSYAIEASYTPFSDTGIFTIYFGTDKEKVEQCMELIRKELDRITSGRLTNHLLSMAKKQFIGQMTIAMENNESYMLGAARSYLIYNSVDSLETARRKIQAVTHDDIVRVSNEILGQNFSILTYK